MKKFFTVLSALFFIGIASINADEKSNGTSSRPLDLQTIKGFSEFQRSINQSVKAFLNDVTKTIEIELLDFTDGEIYIVDQNNQIIDYTPVLDGNTYVIIEQPTIKGYYLLVISSSFYYGEALFYIQ